MYSYILLFIIISSCQQGSKTTDLDTPTSGHITIAADESLAPIIEAEYQVFSSIYKYAVINFIYAPENELFSYIVNDSAQAIIIARPLNQAEEKHFEKIKIFPRPTKIAIDGIAIITHKENTDSSLSYEQLQKIMSGQFQSWKDVNSKSNLGEIQIVFDNAQSGAVRYIREKVINQQALPQNCYALKTNPEVIDYVSKNKNAMGLIGVSWVSDKDDPETLGFLKQINVVGLTNPQDTIGEPGEFFQPYQAYIALKQYPLIRDIYIISAQGRTGLGTGFAAFVASDKGQRIILKAGIMPATQPVRIVNLN
jgi:phosphate transport system substrate-binding protein